MEQTLDMERDQLLRQLTDALQAGPGTPQWHEALEMIRQRQLQGDDESLTEYQSLLQARERLASGKDYKKIHAGDGFTRRLMTRIDEAPKRRSLVPGANTIALISAGLVVVMLGLLVWYMLKTDSKPELDVEQLARTSFVKLVHEADYVKAAPTRLILSGSLGQQDGKGLILPRNNKPGGGLLDVPLASRQLWQVDTTLRLPSKRYSAQIFITDSRKADPDSGVYPRELVCWVRDGELSVLVGRESVKVHDLSAEAAPRDITLSVKFSDSLAVVELDGVRIWGGPHMLASEAKPDRFMGVRLLKDNRGTAVTAISVREP